MGRPTADPLPGARYGRLEVIGPALTGRSDKAMPVRCDCGTEKIVTKGNLNSGRVNSCGCLNVERVKGRAKYPSGSTKTYNIWFAMVRRCTNPEDVSWENYGGRGVTVCDRWKESFMNFWEDMGPAPNGLTLDRKNNEEGYSKDNCKWVTRSQNLFNRRKTVRYKFQGELLDLGEISRRTGVPYKNIYARLYRGLSIEEAVAPVKFKSPNGQPVWNKTKGK